VLEAEGGEETTDDDNPKVMCTCFRLTILLFLCLLKAAHMRVIYCV
jgi:hypothetical protein